jgi:flagellar biosynthesis/type III secretory pathway protein FliH
MSRLVRDAVVTSLPIDVRGREDPLATYGGDLDACLAGVEADAYERGRQDGMRIGYELALADQSQLTALVEGALGSAIARLQSVCEHDAHRLTALALEIARAVVGREPHDDGLALVGRVREALATVDDRPLQLGVHPDDVAGLSHALADVDGLTVAPDPTLTPGEGRLHGRWAEADLTRGAAWLAIQRALAV